MRSIDLRIKIYDFGIQKIQPSKVNMTWYYLKDCSTQETGHIYKWFYHYRETIFVNTLNVTLKLLLLCKTKVFKNIYVMRSNFDIKFE